MGSEMCIRDRLFSGYVSTTGFCVVGFCVLGLSQSLFRLPRRGLLRPTDTLRLPRRGLPRPYRYIQANRLPGTTSSGLPHPSYHAPYKRLGTGGLSHLRVVFSYFSFHRLRWCFHNNNRNLPTEPGAHRTDPLNSSKLTLSFS